VHLLQGTLAPSAAEEMALALALVRCADDLGPTLHVYRPASPVVAFGRRDTRRAGFPLAVAACRDAGFEPVVRPQGGRAVAYTADTVVVDHVEPDPDAVHGMEGRFVEHGHRLAGLLVDLGVDARVGEVPGEYCPGSYSVNARGAVKLVGTAQRVVRGAWLFSAVVVVDGAETLRPVLGEVYRLLDLPFDPSSVGSVGDETGTSVDDVERAVVNRYSAAPLESLVLPGRVRASAQGLVADHRL